MNDKPTFDNDQGGFLWVLIGFLIPVVGLILYFIWNDEKPRRCDSLKTGFTIGFVCWFVTWLMANCGS